MFYAMWAGLLGLLMVFFNGVLERQYNPNRALSYEPGEGGVREVTLERNRFNHYVATGAINGVETVFMLDTGASDISVPAHLAKKLGLKRGAQITYQTANGPAPGYLTELDSVSLGPIGLRGVRASINPNVSNDEVLLGMSFLKHLEFTQRGDTLTLRQYPGQ
ncbi:MAG: TIGR02281 family clan AA aspartic protease [Pseudomonadota bacterium]|nr:MAG: TIGR02281 family clan AA aspartic protease [Pseudomonadota bacterium]